MATQVFISYSSKDAAAVALCHALGNALKAAGYEPFIDRWDISPGDKWEQGIRVALAESHAAVILFSESTLTHHYVLYETGILSIRCHLDEGFKLIPVLFDAVTPEHLTRRRFAPSAIADIQSVKLTTTEQLLEKIVQLLGPASGRVGHRTVVDSLADNIAMELDAFGDMRLKQLVARLGLGISIWTRQKGIAEIATEIARRVLSSGLAGAEQSIRELINIRVNGLESLVELLAPLWVRHEAAGSLRRAPRQMAALNGLYFADFTARMYVRRALWPDSAFEMCPISETSSENRVAHVADEIAKYLMARRPRLKTPKDALGYLKRQKLSLYATLLPPVPSPEELAQLSLEFPSVTFLLHTGERALPIEQLPDLVEPLPELAPEEEVEASDRYNNIVGLLGTQDG
ncbi:toll/interleukin-1 receptor domain-containing protein [Pyxidicoccus trucidator]|uniref:toll/interleukin-1 receptor domain-containing protein n=1 Tax=Pyxidicoccus trucidator TaxID=2709662 RepID=UPI0013DD1FA9|nr:toll/interleukin-1 receptor domain-containing protein [Pyxidicoccus trucidator]